MNCTPVESLNESAREEAGTKSTYGFHVLISRGRTKILSHFLSIIYVTKFSILTFVSLWSVKHYWLVGYCNMINSAQQCFSDIFCIFVEWWKKGRLRSMLKRYKRKKKEKEKIKLKYSGKIMAMCFMCTVRTWT